MVRIVCVVMFDFLKGLWNGEKAVSKLADVNNVLFRKAVDYFDVFKKCCQRFLLILMFDKACSGWRFFLGGYY